MALPAQAAVIIPPGRIAAERRLSFMELDAEADRIARGLHRLGVRPGHRLVLMVPPGIEFLALTFGLFRAGAVAVLIDPGMGLRRVLACLAEVEPDGFVAVPKVQAVRRLRRGMFPNAKLNVCVGRNWFFDATAYSKLVKGDAAFEPPTIAASDPAAILFTSGGTGPPKGVLYEHGMFAAQVELLRERFDVQPGEIDLPAFPLFALFNAAMGVTTVVPDIDTTRPAGVDPRKILDPIRRYEITQAFASPAVWDRVGRYCERAGETIPHLRRVLSAGAPVPLAVLERMTVALERPDADIFTPYGATEALPISSIAASQVLEETAQASREGAGTCVGTLFPGVAVKIVTQTAGPIAALQDVQELPTGAIGEILVRGPAVTRSYFNRPTETALAKVPDGDSFWHRMGDVGYLDDAGRLWFCGRAAHVVTTAAGPLYSVCCEGVINANEAVYRAALVGIGPPGEQLPVMCVEPEPGQFPFGPKRQAAMAATLKALAAAHPVTASIDTFLFHMAFPVDIRHNIKINREKLARWATMRLARDLPEFCGIAPPQDADSSDMDPDDADPDNADNAADDALNLEADTR